MGSYLRCLWFRLYCTSVDWVRSWSEDLPSFCQHTQLFHVMFPARWCTLFLIFVWGCDKLCEVEEDSGLYIDPSNWKWYMVYEDGNTTSLIIRLVWNEKKYVTHFFLLGTNFLLLGCIHTLSMRLNCTNPILSLLITIRWNWSSWFVFFLCYQTCNMSCDTHAAPTAPTKMLFRPPCQLSYSTLRQRLFTVSMA